MALSPKIELRQKQRQVQSATLQLGMAVLAMPATDLYGFLSTAALENPLLEVSPPRVTPTATSVDGQNLAIARTSFSDHLRGQVAVVGRVPAKTRALANELIGFLDNRGLLRENIQQLCDALQMPLSEVAQAVSLLRSCDPAGVAAPDMRSALLAQLMDEGFSTEEAEGQLSALEAGGRSAATAALAKELRPYPAWGFETEATQFAFPELEVLQNRDGTLDVRLLDRHLPGLRIRHDIAALHRNYSRALLQDAKELSGAVEFRKSGLLRMGRALVEVQVAFFSEHGPLVPLTRSELAAMIGVHPTTVGRAAASKYLSWNGRVLPLHSFFPSPVPQRLGQPLSSQDLQARIAALISAEPSDAPLSDAAISVRLEEDGVDIARRTVAKYRRCLKIPSSSERRRLNQRRSPLLQSGAIARHRS